MYWYVPQLYCILLILLISALIVLDTLRYKTATHPLEYKTNAGAFGYALCKKKLNSLR